MKKKILVLLGILFPLLVLSSCKTLNDVSEIAYVNNSDNPSGTTWGWYKRTYGTQGIIGTWETTSGQYQEYTFRSNGEYTLKFGTRESYRIIKGNFELEKREDGFYVHLFYDVPSEHYSEWYKYIVGYWCLTLKPIN